jgi:beta-mannanase
MNGRWYPWSPGVNGNTAADFVAAWRHIHELFASVGATNVTWVWCPNVNPNGKLTPFQDVYPGDAYLDWACLDGYNFGTTWRSFGTIFGSSYLALTESVAPAKPLMIGEVGSVEAGDGSKAAWITDALTTQLPTNFAKVEAFLWFNSYNGGYDWPIESSTSSRTAFPSAIASSYYAPAAASLGILPPVPLQPPS